MLHFDSRWGLPVAPLSGLRLDPVSGLQLTAQISVPCNMYGLVCDAVGGFHLVHPFVGAVVRPSGFSLPPASQTPLPSASASSEAVRPALPLGHSPHPSEGRGCPGEVHCVHRVVPHPSSLHSVGGGGGGGAAAGA